VKLLSILIERQRQPQIAQIGFVKSCNLWLLFKAPNTGEARIDDVAEYRSKGIAQPNLGIIAVARCELFAAQQNFLIRCPAFDQRKLIVNSREVSI